MPLIRGVLAVVLCAGASAGAAMAQRPQGNGDAKETGEVELLILAPDGCPAANAEVLVASPDLVFSRDKLAPQSAMTDENGKAVFAWPVGVLTISP